jgi:tetratricopeptide (TPR) repeat protein
VAHRAVALGSVVAGFLFALIAVAMARLFVRDTPHSKTAALLITLILLSQGYALLFFGYVENYTLFALSIGLYLWLSLLYVRGKVPLVLPALTVVLGTALHLSAAILLPSFGVLVVWALRQRAKRMAVLRDLVITAAAVVGVQVLLSLVNRDYKLFSALAQISGSVLARKEEGIPHGMFSLAHIWDFVNAQFLIGPLGLFFFVPCAIMALQKPEGRTISSVFLAVAGFTALGASWLAGDSNIGAARNWDLLAPMGICYTAAALYFLLHDVTDAARATRMLQFGLLFSLVCFIPWVWINHSEVRSLERFKTLPLGLGRTEVVVGNWYGRNQQPKEAEAWFRRALQVYPYNVNAFILLGELYASQKRYDLACESYAKAVELRPDKESVRVQYVGALFNSGRYEEAVPQLRWLVEKHPDVLGYWDGLGMALSSLGRREELKEVDLHTAMLLANAGRGDDALDKFRRVLATDPDSPAALYNGGSLLLRMGRIDEGRQFLERFIRLYPNDPRSESARGSLGRLK